MKFSETSRKGGRKKQRDQRGVVSVRGAAAAGKPPSSVSSFLYINVVGLPYQHITVLEAHTKDEYLARCMPPRAPNSTPLLTPTRTLRDVLSLARTRAASACAWVPSYPQSLDLVYSYGTFNSASLSLAQTHSQETPRLLTTRFGLANSLPRPITPSS